MYIRKIDSVVGMQEDSSHQPFNWMAENSEFALLCSSFSLSTLLFSGTGPEEYQKSQKGIIYYR